MATTIMLNPAIFFIECMGLLTRITCENRCAREVVSSAARFVWSVILVGVRSGYAAILLVGPCRRLQGLASLTLQKGVADAARCYFKS